MCVYTPIWMELPTGSRFHWALMEGPCLQVVSSRYCSPEFILPSCDENRLKVGQREPSPRRCVCSWPCIFMEHFLTGCCYLKLKKITCWVWYCRTVVLKLLTFFFKLTNTSFSNPHIYNLGSGPSLVELCLLSLWYVQKGAPEALPSRQILLFVPFLQFWFPFFKIFLCIPAWVFTLFPYSSDQYGSSSAALGTWESLGLQGDQISLS